MTRLRVLGAAVAVLALAGCSTLSNPDTVVAGLQSTYLAAATAESVWISSGAATPAQIALVETYRLPAYNAIEPLVQAVETGKSPVTAAQEELATAALAALTNYEISHNIMKGT